MLDSDADLLRRTFSGVLLLGMGRDQAEMTELGESGIPPGAMILWEKRKNVKMTTVERQSSHTQSPQEGGTNENPCPGNSDARHENERV